jgi:hypothetical protein
MQQPAGLDQLALEVMMMMMLDLQLLFNGVG